MLFRCVIAATLLAATSACVKSPETALQQLMEARRLSADLLVQFTKADDASNRAVMADTDESSIGFAHEAEDATQSIQKDLDALAPVLTDLGFSSEAHLRQEFEGRFAEYRTLDHTILGLAVENTNLKAQRLSFSAAVEAAEAFRQSLGAVVPADQLKDACTSKALVATAVADVREIQVLQAPHIAEASAEVMTRLEQQMAEAERDARNTLKSLDRLASSSSRSKVEAAAAALDRFIAVNAQIVSLSRRNTNVRSLTLSLGQKRTFAAACESSLQALQDALAKRGFIATR